MDSIQRKFLITGGILVCGYIAYSILKKREELNQQEVTEEADYVIIVEKADAADTEIKKHTSKESTIRAEKIIEEKVSILNVVKDVEVKKSDENQTTDISLIENEHEPIKPETAIVEASKVEIVEVDMPLIEEVNAIEVVAPIEVKKQANDNFPLQLGSKGKRVWNLRAYMLRNHGASGVVVTDDYDKLTVERVKSFLKVDTITEQLYTELNMENRRKNRRNATTKKKH